MSLVILRNYRSLKMLEIFVDSGGISVFEFQSFICSDGFQSWNVQKCHSELS